MGHEERFVPPRLSAGYQFRQEPFGSTRGAWFSAARRLSV